MTTLEEGRMSTWRLPRFSALQMETSALFRTLMSTIYRRKKNDSERTFPTLELRTIRHPQRPNLAPNRHKLRKCGGKNAARGEIEKK
jgi:hypothetical protein